MAGHRISHISVLSSSDVNQVEYYNDYDFCDRETQPQSATTPAKIDINTIKNEILTDGMQVSATRHCTSYSYQYV